MAAGRQGTPKDKTRRRRKDAEATKIANRKKNLEMSRRAAERRAAERT